MRRLMFVMTNLTLTTPNSCPPRETSTSTFLP